MSDKQQEAQFSPNSPFMHLTRGVDLIHEMWRNIDSERAAKDPKGILNEWHTVLDGVEHQLNGVSPLKAFDWKERVGVKPVQAKDLVDLVDAQIPYICEPLIARGFLTQIQGIPKGGKSAFSIYLSMCLTTGTWPHPDHIQSSAPVKVLYLSWEDPAIMMAKRLSLYGVGLGFGRKFMPENLTFLFAPDLFINRIDHAEALKAAIKEIGADVVFIDTLSQVHSCEENDASEMKIPMRVLMGIAEQLQIGIVYLHHVSKSTNGKATVDKGRGSGSIGAAWHILIDWGVRTEGSNVNPVEIQSKLAHEWLYWNVEYSPDRLDEVDPKKVTGVRWSIKSQEQKEKQKELKSTDRKRVRCLETLKGLSVVQEDGWVSAAMVTSACGLGIDQRSVKSHLQVLCESGDVLCKTGEKNALLFKPSGV